MVSQFNHHSIAPFFNNNSPPPRQFLRDKALLKKISLGNADWINYWIWIEGAWAPSNSNSIIHLPEVESSRTSLASRTSSRTHFEVLGLGLEGQVFGLGLEASNPRKLACPRLEDSTIFWIVKILWSAWKIFWKTFFCGDCLKNFCEDLFFFWRALAFVFLVLGLGLKHSCPWPRECLSLKRLSLASDFFVSLALASSLVSSTPPLTFTRTCTYSYNWLFLWKNNNL